MNGFIKHFTAASCFGAALFTVTGCEHYRNLVDPCWPERYNSLARASVREMHHAQTDKGHKLDQTLWNTYFVHDEKTKEGTSVLNDAGKQFLRSMARRQPFPDPQLWLQYPEDVPAERRDQVIQERKVNIQNFLTKETLAGGGSNYQIAVHDHVQPTYPAEWTEKAYNQINIQGRLVTTQGGSSGGGAGGAGTGGGGAGGTGGGIGR